MVDPTRFSLPTHPPQCIHGQGRSRWPWARGPFATAAPLLSRLKVARMAKFDPFLPFHASLPLHPGAIEGKEGRDQIMQRSLKGQTHTI